MTAQAEPAATLTGRSLGEIITSIPFRPAEGWLSLFAAAAMVGLVAGSFIDAGWTGGPASDSGFLPWVGFAGLAFGLFGAKVGWGRWRTHLVGALFAGFRRDACRPRGDCLVWREHGNRYIRQGDHCTSRGRSV